ncbi:type II toxin-antitoxin system RelB/DinJ family antitoxin [Candidatus Thiosymbion oneisti]|uniref:type II toxin-antitoxin system RelB/DinJ family antitoxin n=1 Tax=Candidatus Thiosymbion oneisti TaxID=589554 RepID=UPI000A5B018F|nr:type II toxin-antitoxin system RelB/DinJ family antitoxin [Candidatus Thiosymbion oneisti]
MMPAEDLVRMRIDKQLRAEASEVLKAMGLSMSDAVRLLLVRIARDKALPFEVEIPNATTVATFEATDRDEDIVRCKDTADMFDKLGL